LKIQINSKKPGFGRKNQLRTGVTLGPTAQAALSIYEGRKIVLFFFFFPVMRSTNRDASYHVLGVFGKLPMRPGAWAWFHDVWTCGGEVLEY